MKPSAPHVGRVLVVAFALLSVLAGAALASAGVATLREQEVTKQFRAVTSKAAPKIANSRAGRAVISAKALAPGQAVYGKTRLRNTGRVPGVLFLSVKNLKDLPQDGQKLSGQLWLRVWWSDRRGKIRTVWYGRLNRLKRARVCVLNPGQARWMRFSAQFGRGTPQPAGIENALMSHEARFRLVWRIVARS
jgi:hypothetical protein